jgi:hypothetical protein
MHHICDWMHTAPAAVRGGPAHNLHTNLTNALQETEAPLDLSEAGYRGVHLQEHKCNMHGLHMQQDRTQQDKGGTDTAAVLLLRLCWYC